MKSLSLYIDRWYIAAAINSDNIPHRVVLPNKEDRIWLYFYEDIYNDRVIYGKNYQRHFLDKELNYNGDIFAKIIKNGETFKRFGKDVSIKEIFKASEIFDHLRSEFSENEVVNTYISFSADVSYAAQKVFLDILDENSFSVKESVARISHLAVELSNKKGLLDDSKCILVVTACNENLRFVVYKRSEKVFIRKGNEGILKGHGTDLRGRALLEQIVWEINNSSKFLNKEEEEYEIIRLSQNLEPWLLRLDNTKQGRPVVYNEITFSRTPYNKQSATILKNVIEERTKAIVNIVVDNIVQHVINSDVITSDISHVIFVGDSFKNAMFKEALLQRYPVNSSHIINYLDKDLPEIVGIYSQIDLSQFDSLRKNIDTLSQEQLEQIRIAEKDRKAREQAEMRQKEINQANAAVKEAEKKFAAAMQDAENYEKKGDYSSMIDLLNIALQIKPEDTDAKNQLEQATRKLSEIKVKSEQYNKIIRQAQDAFKERKWQEAYSKASAALDLKPDSLEATRIKSDSERKQKLLESVKEFLLRADTFIGQKLYKEALEELKKAKYADADNSEINQRIKKIELVQKAQQEQVKNLKDSLDKLVEVGNYEEAIKICSELMDKDSENNREWRERIITLRDLQNKQKVQTELFDNLQKRIHDADFNDNWSTLLQLCPEALTIKKDSYIERIYNKAKVKYEVEQKEENYQSLVHKITSLIVEKNFEEATSLTKQLQSDFPEHKDKAKSLFRRIFEAEEPDSEKMLDDAIDENKHIPVVGFKQNPKTKTDKVKNKDFFEEDFVVPEKAEKPKRTTSHNPTKKPQTDTSFFDSFSQQQSTKKKKITNDDFNF